jgi:hypothetical protein
MTVKEDTICAVAASLYSPPLPHCTQSIEESTNVTSLDSGDMQVPYQCANLCQHLLLQVSSHDRHCTAQLSIGGME